MLQITLPPIVTKTWTEEARQRGIVSAANIELRDTTFTDDKLTMLLDEYTACHRNKHRAQIRYPVCRCSTIRAKTKQPVTRDNADRQLLVRPRTVLPLLQKL